MQFAAKIVWERNSQEFLDQRYDRAHEWQFDGGLRVPASSSPLSVQQQLAALHHAVHEQCYIADSLKSAVRVEAIAL